MNSKPIRYALVSIFFAGALAACGSDSGSESVDTTDVESTEVAVGTATEPAGDEPAGDGSANPDVVAYCESADELAAELKDVMADPANADVASVTAKASELTSKAAGLISASPDDIDEINACSQRLTEAVTPAG